LSTDRWANTAERLAALEESRREQLTEHVRSFLQPSGTERALDAGTGTGALAFALAPHVAEVLGVDRESSMLEQARLRAAAYPNVTFAEGDIEHLDLVAGAFDVAGCARTLHHVRRPELAISELARVTRPGGHVLLIDQIGPADPLVAVELDRFERARDSSHTRLLPDIDVRALLEANELILVRSEFVAEPRDLERYLDLAGCEGDARERAAALAPADFGALVGWYLASKPLPRT
jgi:SAM-dependent methyltransferase